MASAGYKAFNPPTHSLFRRCLKCDTTPPSCPVCSSDETCSLSAISCDACPSTSCVKIGSLPGHLEVQKPPPLGAIIGGVIGGVVAIAVMTYVVWRFCIRPKRQAMGWTPPEKRAPSTLAARSARQSTRSAHSIASTVLTRASNVIQIAYIPGVTVRSPPSTPGLLAPPLPSMFGSSANSSAQSSPMPEQHFFMPGDLRDSTWSDRSGFDSRHSLAPSLLYETEVVPPIPAQQAFRAQANVVSVKSGTTTPSGKSSNSNMKASPVPQLPNLGSSIVARNVTARPIEVKKSKAGPRVPTLANLARQSPKKNPVSIASGSSVPVFYDEKEVVSSQTSLMDDTPVSPISPFVRSQPSFISANSAHTSTASTMMFADTYQNGAPSGSGDRQTSVNGLNVMIENAINRATGTHASAHNDRSSRPELRKHDSGPFSDSNEFQENLPRSS